MADIQSNINRLKNMFLLKYKLIEKGHNLVVKIEAVTFYFIFNSGYLYRSNSIILDSDSSIMFLSSISINKKYENVIFVKTNL